MSAPSVLNFVAASPEENLACDEALLDACESGEAGEVLRFWESPTYFVVVGNSNRLQDEVNVAACEASGIPMLRRCSGGGTVLQGPGCLSYALVLSLESEAALASITGTNRFIMERHRAACAEILGRPVEVCGHTDLAWRGRKFSGNAQRRKRRALLFHGTFLLGFDLSQIERFLRLPTRQPEYREARGHLEFLTRLELTPRRMQEALCRAWGATGDYGEAPVAATRAWVAERYGRREWNWKC